MEAIDTRWRKSSFSGNGGNCVEVADRDSRILVRDTRQHGHGPTLRFTPDAWKAFAKQLKSLASNKRKRPFPGNHLGGPFSFDVRPLGVLSTESRIVLRCRLSNVMRPVGNVQIRLRAGLPAPYSGG
jgi:hypothetical protein